MGGTMVGLTGLAVAIALVQLPHRRVVAALLFCWAALLPASHIALLDATMSGTRVYHLASVGMALLFGAVAEGIRRSTARALVVSAVLTLQASVLCHNLLIWRGTAELAGKVCRTFPKRIAPQRSAVVQNLPWAFHGVYFLANAFPECVAVNSGTAVTILPAAPPGTDLPHFKWSNELRALVEVRNDAR